MTLSELEKRYKETVPEEINSFVSVLRVVKSSGEMTSTGLMTCLCSIVESEIEECRRIGAKGDEMTVEDRRRVAKAALLTACCLIFLCETRSRTEIRKKTLLLLEYISYLQTSDHNLLRVAADACSYLMTFPGFTLSQLENTIGVEMIAYNLAQNATFDRKVPLVPLVVSSAGSVTVKNGVITVSSAPVWRQTVRSFSAHGGVVEICTRDVRDERLKASEVDQVAPLEDFSRLFLMSQDKSAKERLAKNRSRLVQGRSYTIGRISRSGEIISCIVLDADHDGRCELKSEELVKGLYTDDLVDYLFEDDCIAGALLVEDGEMPLFSVKEAYLRYANDRAEKDCRQKRVYEAKVVDFFSGQTEDKDRVILLSDNGYGGLMYDDRSLCKGETVKVYTQSLRNWGNNLFINMAVPEFEYSEIPEKFDVNNVLSDFVTDESAVPDTASGDGFCKSGADIAEVEIVRQLGIILSRSKERSSIARYRDIVSSAFFFNVIGDKPMRDRSMTEVEFLGQCLRMAEGMDVRERPDAQRLPEQRKRIVKLLCGIGNKMEISEMASIVQQMTDEGDRKVAELFLAYSLVRSNPDCVKASLEEIRRKICSLLGVGDHFKGDVAKGGGKYGKGELANVEFKASYVFYNRDGKPDLLKQGRGQVLEAVCGFLNKDGGVVYVGVSDSGDPLVDNDYGLRADIAWFGRNFDTVNLSRTRMLHHQVPQPKDLDSYCRFLNYELELYFKAGVRGLITIAPTEDQDAIRITVQPSEFEIAKLYTDNTWKTGTVYVRDGLETKPMNRHEQELRLMNLRRVGKIEQFILTLTEAIDRKEKVILKNYASGNSNLVQDRLVAPINLVCNDENLWAYDFGKKECREFRLSRIDSIETGFEDSGYSHSYPDGKADVFRWINPDVNYHIKLKMSIFALNNLREEYSDSKNLPASELYPAEDGSDKWILDTTLHGLGAVMRFYIGMADQIEIMETEDSARLQSAIRTFVSDNLRQD